MSYDQAIKHGKTRRKPYKGGKAVDEEGFRKSKNYKVTRKDTKYQPNKLSSKWKRILDILFEN